MTPAALLLMAALLFLATDPERKPMADTPVSPKVVAAGIWGVAFPIVIALVSALISYLTVGDGAALLESLPSWAQVLIPVVLSAVGAVIGGYNKADPLREV
jgi:hypothetical protein